jgi:hypothetical protein
MASGVNYTILRPNFFMENFATGFLAPMVRQGEIYLAARDGKSIFISTGESCRGQPPTRDSLKSSRPNAMKLIQVSRRFYVIRDLSLFQ